MRPAQGEVFFGVGVAPWATVTHPPTPDPRGPELHGPDLSGPSRPERRRPGHAQLVLAPLGAAAAGVAAGLVGVGLTVALVNTADAGDGWGDLAAVVLGVLLSVGLGVVVWLAMLVAAARRLFPRGERLVPLLLSAGGVLGLVLAAAVASAADQTIPGSGPLLVLGACLIGAFVLSPAVFWLCGTTRRRPGPPPGWPLPPP